MGELESCVCDDLAGLALPRNDGVTAAAACEAEGGGTEGLNAENTFVVGVAGEALAPVEIDGVDPVPNMFVNGVEAAGVELVDDANSGLAGDAPNPTVGLDGD